MSSETTRSQAVWILRVLIVVSLLAIVISSFIFSPITYEVRSGGSATLNGKPVVRYGFSRVHQQVFFTAKDGSGDRISGRCFVDVEENGEVERIYGWKLKRHISRHPDRSARKRTLTIE